MTIAQLARVPGPALPRFVHYPASPAAGRHVPKRAVTDLRRRAAVDQAGWTARQGPRLQREGRQGTWPASPLRYNVSQRGANHGDHDGSRSRGREDEAEGGEDAGRDGHLGIRRGSHVAGPRGCGEGSAVRGEDSQRHHGQGDARRRQGQGEAVTVPPTRSSRNWGSDRCGPRSAAPSSAAM